MDISVVIPVYNEAEALPGLHRALAEALDRLPQSAEIIFTNDGSIDGSADRLDAIAKTDPRVRVLHMSRNYGQTAALMAAIQNSTGDVVIPMDGDGQNDPADIPRLLEKLAEGFDVVSGWRLAREDNTLTRRLPSIVANWLISALLMCRCTITDARSKPTGGRSSKTFVSTARCTDSSRSTPPGREHALARSVSATIHAGSVNRNMGSVESRGCCWIC